MDIIKLHATDSTNSYLKELARKIPIPDETIVVTENQKKGRGQRGNGWYSTPEGSLTLSLYKRFNTLHVSEHFKIAMAVSLALVELLENLNVPKTKIKWPNDIMSGNKKLAGILIENTLVQDTIKSSIIGIGLNVNLETFPNLPRAGSIFSCSGAIGDKEQIFSEISRLCLKYLNEVEQKSFAEWKGQYEPRMFRIHQVSTFEDCQSLVRFSGIIKGISETGSLLVEKDDGMIEQVGIKELRLLY